MADYDAPSGGEVSTTTYRDGLGNVVKTVDPFLLESYNIYDAMGRQEANDLTVPAINIRGMTYDMARQVFKAAVKNHVGPVIFEIASSEIG